MNIISLEVLWLHRGSLARDEILFSERMAKAMSQSVSTFYVATNGNDSWSGLLKAPNQAGTDGPFATLERAQLAMRDDPTINTTLIRGGLYHLDETLRLTEADAGTRWQAYGTERAVLSGGQVVTGWTAEGNGVYSAQAPVTGSRLDVTVTSNGSPHTQQRLHAAVDGVAATAPPTAGWHVADTAGLNGSTEFRFKEGELTPDKIGAGTQLHLFHSGRWQDTYSTIKSIDWATRTVTLDTPVTYGLDAGSTWQLVADQAGLDDAKGTFAWRASDGALLIRPTTATFNPAVQKVEVAVLETLIRTDNADNVTISGLTFTNTKTGWDGAVHIDNSDGVTISGNTFNAVGKAITLGWQANGGTVTNNIIKNTGQAGIDAIHAESNLISNNTFTDIGEVWNSGSGILIGGGSNNIVDHNVFTNIAHHGIAVSSWGPVIPSGTQITNNIINGASIQTADSGGIYLFNGVNADFDMNTLIDGNRIEGVAGVRANLATGQLIPTDNTSGIYLDNLVGGVTITDNLIVKAPLASVFVHGGQDNVISNNVAILPDTATFILDGVAGPGVSCMHLNGDLEYQADPSLFTAKATRIKVTAWAETAANIGAHFQLLVDGEVIGHVMTTTNVSEATAKTYSFTKQLTAGVAHKITIRYDNDEFVGDEDRNLFIGAIQINNQLLEPQQHGTFILFRPADTGGAGWVQPSNTVVTHNIVAAHGTDQAPLWDYGATNPTSLYDYNLLHNVASEGLAAVDGDAHSVHADPLFIDPAHGNYHLAANSPAYGVGYVDPGWIW